jgi:peptidoglycan/xylan/chitin deacetylase (PgdA/CDA1 family)
MTGPPPGGARGAPPLSHRVKAAVKRGAAAVLHVTGLFPVIARSRLRGRAVVLMYHRVLAGEDEARSWSHPGIVVRADTFARHMALLRRHFLPLTLEAFEAHLRERRPFPPGACLVTFDDGWLDTGTVAWPMLRAAGVPAVVFLPSDYIGTGAMFWQERLRALLHDAWRNAGTDAAFADRVRPVLAAHGYGWLLDVPAADIRMALMDGVLSRKYGELDASAALTSTLEALLAGRPRAEVADAFMTWPQVGALAAEGLAFGGHGRTHRLLTDVTLDEVSAEAAASRQAIAAVVGAAPRTFAYPNGNWNDEVAGRVEGAGYSLAFTTDSGHVAAADRPFAIRRINIHESATGSAGLFMARLLGLF